MKELFKWIVVVLLSGAVMSEVAIFPSLSLAEETRSSFPLPVFGILVAQAKGRTISCEATAVVSSGSTEESGHAQAQDPKPQTESSGFMVDQYLVEGNSLLTAEKIDTILAKHKGIRLTLKDIEEAKNELEKAYRDVGYPTVLVTIPEQTIEGGTVRLLV